MGVRSFKTYPLNALNITLKHYNYIYSDTNYKYHYSLDKAVINLEDI